MADKAKSDKVDLNTASRDELVAVPGIGDAGADAIVKYRKEHGRFAGVDDLVRVPGIGGATLETVRAHLAVSSGGNKGGAGGGKNGGEKNGAEDAAAAAGRETAAAAKRAAEQPAQAARKAGEAGAEVVRFAAAEEKATAQAGAAAVREAAGAVRRTAEQVGEPLARQTAEVAARGYDALRGGAEEAAKASQAVLGDASEFSRLWMSYWNEQLTDGMTTARQLAECRNWQEALEVQNAFARASFERAWSRMARSAELTARMFADGFGPLQRQGAASVARSNRPAS